MSELTRRDAIRTAAAVGVAALGTSALAAGGEKVAKAADNELLAQKEHPNAGQHVESKALPTALGPREVWAVVGADGKLCRGHYVKSSAKLGTGQYEVIFTRDVRLGVYLATIGLCGSVGASPPGEINVVGRVSSVNGVFIETADSAGKLADRGFHLLVVNPEGFA
jgi:hypothetical protein